MSYQPGIYPNIPFEQYKKIEAVSNSYLSRLDKCPAAGAVEREETPSLILGRAVHTSVLEGRIAFNERFVVAPEINRKTNAGKEEWALFCAENSDRQIITKDQLEIVSGVSAAVYAHPSAKKLLAENVTEQTVIWTDKKTGLLCKARPDAVPDAGKMSLIDLKSTSDASLEGFTRSVSKYGYARQAAFYTDGYNQATGSHVDAFWFIAVETEPPYRTEVYFMDSDFIDWGREKYRALLEIEKKCREQKFYPHYKNEFETLFKPAYLY